MMELAGKGIKASIINMLKGLKKMSSWCEIWEI